MDAPTCQAHTIPTPRGALQACSWLPPTPQGAPILLFHDSLGCVALWRDFPAALAQATGRQVVAYDRLGFGRSAPRQDLLTRSFIADEALHNLPALREALRLDRFVALGHSVGGAMAVSTAAALPDACEAVVTIAAQAFVEDRTLTGIREAEAGFAAPEQLARLAKYHGEQTAWVLRAWIDTWCSPAFADWTLDATLAQLRCPLLVLHGDRDEYGSAAQPRRLQALAGAGARMQLLPDCGHVPQREQPQAVLASVCEFLNPPG